MKQLTMVLGLVVCLGFLGGCDDGDGDIVNTETKVPVTGTAVNDGSTPETRNNQFFVVTGERRGVGTDTGKGGIVLCDRNTGVCKTIFENGDRTAIEITQQGNLIVFSASLKTCQFPIVSIDLFRVKIDGTGLRQLTGDGTCRNVSYTGPQFPVGGDGSKVLARLNNGITGVKGIVSVPVNSGVADDFTVLLKGDYGQPSGRMKDGVLEVFFTALNPVLKIPQVFSSLVTNEINLLLGETEKTLIYPKVFSGSDQVLVSVLKTDLVGTSTATTTSTTVSSIGGAVSATSTSTATSTATSTTVTTITTTVSATSTTIVTTTAVTTNGLSTLSGAIGVVGSGSQDITYVTRPQIGRCDLRGDVSKDGLYVFARTLGDCEDPFAQTQVFTVRSDGSNELVIPGLDGSRMAIFKK